MEHDEISLANFDALAKKYRPLMSKLVISVRRSYNNSVEFDDLYQEALTGLFRAIELYDPTKAYFGVYLKKAVLMRLLSYTRTALPHYYRKDADHPGKFKRVTVQISSLDPMLGNN
jgi:DNA-directed RNA polymerase specialized sigma subunit